MGVTYLMLFSSDEHDSVNWHRITFVPYFTLKYLRFLCCDGFILLCSNCLHLYNNSATQEIAQKKLVKQSITILANVLVDRIQMCIRDRS